jgi:hypothetical protein
MTIAHTIPVAAAQQVNFDKGLVAKPETYDAIYAFAESLGWTEKPFSFVVDQWLASRS